MDISQGLKSPSKSKRQAHPELAAEKGGSPDLIRSSRRHEKENSGHINSQNSPKSHRSPIKRIQSGLEEIQMPITPTGDAARQVVADGGSPLRRSPRILQNRIKHSLDKKTSIEEVPSVFLPPPPQRNDDEMELTGVQDHQHQTAADSSGSTASPAHAIIDSEQHSGVSYDDFGLVQESMELTGVFPHTEEFKTGLTEIVDRSLAESRISALGFSTPSNRTSNDASRLGDRAKSDASLISNGSPRQARVRFASFKTTPVETPAPKQQRTGPLRSALRRPLSERPIATAPDVPSSDLSGTSSTETTPSGAPPKIFTPFSLVRSVFSENRNTHSSPSDVQRQLDLEWSASASRYAEKVGAGSGGSAPHTKAGSFTVPDISLSDMDEDSLREVHPIPAHLQRKVSRGNTLEISDGADKSSTPNGKHDPVQYRAYPEPSNPSPTLEREQGGATAARVSLPRLDAVSEPRIEPETQPEEVPLPSAQPEATPYSDHGSEPNTDPDSSISEPRSMTGADSRPVDSSALGDVTLTVQPAGAVALDSEGSLARRSVGAPSPEPHLFLQSAPLESSIDRLVEEGTPNHSVGILAQIADGSPLRPIPGTAIKTQLSSSPSPRRKAPQGRFKQLPSSSPTFGLFKRRMLVESDIRLEPAQTGTGSPVNLSASMLEVESSLAVAEPSKLDRVVRGEFGREAASTELAEQTATESSIGASMPAASAIGETSAIADQLSTASAQPAHDEQGDVRDAEPGSQEKTYKLAATAGMDRERSESPVDQGIRSATEAPLVLANSDGSISPLGPSKVPEVTPTLKRVRETPSSSAQKFKTPLTAQKRLKLMSATKEMPSMLISPFKALPTLTSTPIPMPMSAAGSDSSSILGDVPATISTERLFELAQIDPRMPMPKTAELPNGIDEGLKSLLSAHTRDIVADAKRIQVQLENLNSDWPSYLLHSQGVDDLADTDMLELALSEMKDSLKKQCQKETLVDNIRFAQNVREQQHIEIQRLQEKLAKLEQLRRERNSLSQELLRLRQVKTSAASDARVTSLRESVEEKRQLKADLRAEAELKRQHIDGLGPDGVDKIRTGRCKSPVQLSVGGKIVAWQQGPRDVYREANKDMRAIFDRFGTRSITYRPGGFSVELPYAELAVNLHDKSSSLRVLVKDQVLEFFAGQLGDNPPNLKADTWRRYIGVYEQLRTLMRLGWTETQVDGDKLVVIQTFSQGALKGELEIVFVGDGSPQITPRVASPEAHEKLAGARNLAQVSEILITS